MANPQAIVVRYQRLYDNIVISSYIKIFQVGYNLIGLSYLTYCSRISNTIEKYLTTVEAGSVM